MPFEIRSTRWIDRSAILLVLGTSALLALLGSATWPAADDFCNRMLVHVGGLSGALDWLWHQWSGRLATSLPIYFLLGRVPVEDLRWVNALLALLPTLLAWQMLRFWRLERSSLTLPLWALLLGLLIVGLHPLLNQTVFWFTGGVVYLLPLVLVIHWLDSYRRLVADPTQAAKTGYWLPVSVLLGNAIELVWPILFVYVGADAFSCWRRWPAATRRAVAWRVLGLLLGAALLLAAPGNYRRAQLSEHAPGLHPWALLENFANLLAQAMALGQTLWILLGTALAVAVRLYRRRRGLAPGATPAPGDGSPPWREAGLIALGAVLSLAPLSVVPDFFSPRNGLYLYAFASLGTLGLLSADLRNLGKTAAAKSWAAAALLLGVATTTAAVLAIAPDIAPARALQGQLAARHQRLLELRSQGVRIAELAPITAPAPSTLHYVELFDDSAQWLNMCMAKSYDLDEVRLKKASVDR